MHILHLKFISFPGTEAPNSLGGSADRGDPF